MICPSSPCGMFPSFLPRGIFRRSSDRPQPHKIFFFVLRWKCCGSSSRAKFFWMAHQLFLTWQQKALFGARKGGRSKQGEELMFFRIPMTQLNARTESALRKRMESLMYIDSLERGEYPRTSTSTSFPPVGRLSLPCSVRQKNWGEIRCIVSYLLCVEYRAYRRYLSYYP